MKSEMGFPQVGPISGIQGGLEFLGKCYISGASIRFERNLKSNIFYHKKLCSDENDVLFPLKWIILVCSNIWLRTLEIMKSIQQTYPN